MNLKGIQRKAENMRDIKDYEEHYMEHPFERYMEKYRRNLLRGMIADYAKAGCSIVEIGCGLLPLFADYQDEYLFTVIEPAERCYENARKMAENQNNVRCCQGFFEDIAEELKENQYDIIICSNLLHEVENPRRFLSAIRLLCHQDSIVHINVPNAFSVHRLLAKAMGLMEDVHQLSDTNLELQQHSVFDIETLKQLADAAGYQVIGEGSYFIKPFTHRQMQQCMDLQIINEDVLDGLDLLCKSCLKEYGAEIYLNMRLKRE